MGWIVASPALQDPLQSSVWRSAWGIWLAANEHALLGWHVQQTQTSVTMQAGRSPGKVVSGARDISGPVGYNLSDLRQHT